MTLGTPITTQTPADLSGMRALVTGGTRGIGKGITDQLRTMMGGTDLFSGCYRARSHRATNRLGASWRGVFAQPVRLRDLPF